MTAEKIVKKTGTVFRVFWTEICTFSLPVIVFLLGLGCAAFLSLFSSYIGGIMLFCAILFYLLSRRSDFWMQVFLGSGFIMFMGAASFFTLMTALFIDLAFPPNGAQHYKHVLIGDFFPSEIPETAYDVQVYSISGFGQGWNEAYLSYRDAPEHIAPYAEMARERAQKQSRSPYINEGIRVPKITVDETCIDPRFLEDPWARFFLDYVPHPVKIESLDEPFVFYIWDTNESWNHPKGSIVGVSEDGTHIIFYLVGP